MILYLKIKKNLFKYYLFKLKNNFLWFVTKLFLIDWNFELIKYKKLTNFELSGNFLR